MTQQVQVVIVEQPTLKIVDESTGLTVVQSQDSQLQLLTEGIQGPAGLNPLAVDLVGSNPDNNLQVDLDNKLVSLPKLSSTNW